MFKIAICDDEKDICNFIENTIINYNEINKIRIDTEIFFSGESLCKYLRSQGTFDIIFLDIELENMNGIDVGNEIRKHMQDYNTKIVYISGKTEYCMSLFDVQPMNFLLKPIEPIEIIKNIELGLKLSGKDTGYFYFKISGQTHKVQYNDIIYLESQMRKVIVFSRDTTYEYYGKFEEIIFSLPHCFAQVHRSYIVNMNKISVYGKGTVTMINNEIIPISKTYLKQFKDKQIDELAEWRLV